MNLLGKKLTSIIGFSIIFIITLQMIGNNSVVQCVGGIKVKKTLILDNYKLEKMPRMVKKEVEKNQGKPLQIVEDGADKCNSVTVLNEDGTKTLTIFPYDIKYIENNEVKFIDDSLKKAENAKYEYESINGNLKKQFSKNPNIGVKMGWKNYAIEMIPILNEEKMNKSKGISFNRMKDVSFEKSERKITYNKIFTDNIKIKYVSELNGIKEDIVISKYEGINTFCFKVNTNGLIPGKMSGEGMAIPLIDPQTKKVVMSIGQVFSYDSNYEKNETGSSCASINNKLLLEKTEKKDEYLLTVVVDKKFLESKNTVYPVTIDPSVTIPATYLQNTLVFSDNPNDQNWWSSLMFVGHHNLSGYGDCQMYNRLTNVNDYTYISPSKITRVNYNIYEWSGKQSACTVDLYDLCSKTWSQTDINYNNKPDLCGARQTYQNYPPSNKWSEFDITNLFKSWLKNELSEGGFSKDYGFCLKSSSPTEDSRYYYTSTDSSKPTTISVWYTEDLSASNGIYYLKNVASGKVLNADQSLNNNVNVASINGKKNQHWRIERNINSEFCKLYNQWPQYNEKVLDAVSSSGNSNVDLWNGSATSPWVYFRMIKNEDGTYRIMNVWGDKLNRALTATDSSSGEEDTCTLSTYTAADNQRWRLEKVHNATINSYYDQAFPVRYSNAGNPEEGINSVNEKINKHFAKELYLYISNNTPTQITSTADSCKLNRGLEINQTTINQLCPGGVGHTPKCTGWDQSYLDFIAQYPGNSTRVSVLWTGNRLETNRSFSWINNGITIQEIGTNNSSYYDSRACVLVHEYSHQFGAPDHYHEILENGDCRSGENCSVCGSNPREASCIMCSGWRSDILTCDSDDVWCDRCRQDMNGHVEGHH